MQEDSLDGLVLLNFLKGDIRPHAGTVIQGSNPSSAFLVAVHFAIDTPTFGM